MSFLKEYTKTIFYTYPLLRTVEKDYEEHIKNKALLSFDGRVATEKLAEYIAKEIIEKDKLAWLKGQVEGILQRLSEEERTLVCIRFFRTKNIRDFVRKDEDTDTSKWSERMYFRRQKRLEEKLGAMLDASGLTEEFYEKEFSYIDIFKRVDRLVKKGEKDKDKKRA